MSMQDPIADMLTQIRNAQAVREGSIVMPSSTFKVAILKVLKEEGYIEDYQVIEKDKKKSVKVNLKYYQEKPVISKIQRISRPGLRVYKHSDRLPNVMFGMGIAIISTPQGVMTAKNARASKQGGEVLCIVE